MNAKSFSIEDRYEKALVEAALKLASLDVVCGRSINLKGLRGWLFEQTVLTCLDEELKKQCVNIDIKEQVSIGGRAKVDFLVGSVALEVKAAGFFDNEGARYSDYRNKVESKGWHYLYLTLRETHQPYVEIARKTFGDDKAFFLDQKGSWLRFISTVVYLVQK